MYLRLLPNRAPLIPCLFAGEPATSSLPMDDVVPAPPRVCAEAFLVW